MLGTYFKNKFSSHKEEKPSFVTPFFHSNGKTNVSFSFIERKLTNSGSTVPNKLKVEINSNRVSKIQLTDLDCYRIYDDADKHFIQLQYDKNGALKNASYFVLIDTMTHDDLADGPLNVHKQYNFAFFFDEKEYIRDVDTHVNDAINYSYTKETIQDGSTNDIRYMIYSEAEENDFGNHFLYFEESASSYNLYKMNEVDTINIKFFNMSN